VLGVVERADDVLPAWIREAERMANIDTIVPGIEEDRERRNLVLLARRADQSVDRLLDAHQQFSEVKLTFFEGSGWKVEIEEDV
jgi:hypothetical protein